MKCNYDCLGCYSRGRKSTDELTGPQLDETDCRTIGRPGYSGICSGLRFARYLAGGNQHKPDQAVLPFDIRIEIWPGRFAPIKLPRLAPRPEKINCASGWYKGGLHVHTTDSDDTCPLPCNL